MLKTKGDSFEGKTVIVSGSGNVAQYATEKATELGGKVVTMSDSSGYIYDADEIDAEKLAHTLWRSKMCVEEELVSIQKNTQTAKFFAGERPWSVAGEVALPCATQNELNGEEAKDIS